MRDALIAILLCGVAVAACDARRTDAADAAASATAAAAALAVPGKAGDADLEVHADIASGRLAMKLPGGIAGSVRLPDGMAENAELDLEGVGRFPGARMTGVDVNAFGKRGDAGSRAVVELGFTAPGRAAAVADFYEKAFIGSGRTVLRNGTMLTTTTRDGKPLVMAVEDGAGNVARGKVTILDNARG